MKALRVFLTVIMSMTLSFLLFVLLSSYLIKQVQNQVLVETVKAYATSQATEEGTSSAEMINNLYSLKGSNDVIDRVIDDFIKHAEDGSEVSDETIDSIINFCLENKSELEKMFGETIDENELRSIEARNNLKDALNEGLSTVNIEDNKPVKTVLSIYKKFTSDNFRTTLIITILVLIALIALLNLSVYKWMTPVGIVLINNGIVTTILFIVLFVFKSVILSQIEAGIEIDTSLLLKFSLAQTIGGIVLVVISSLISKNKKLKEENNKLESNYS